MMDERRGQVRPPDTLPMPSHSLHDQAEFDAEHEKLVWTHPGVTNWYKNKSGRVVTNNPWRLSRYRNMTAEFDTDEYVIRNEKAPA